MKKFFAVFFIYLFVITNVNAYELILPTDRKNVVTNKYAFFVGKLSGGESLTINNELIHSASNGAFAHSVKLKNGENRIILRSNYSTRIFNFLKENPKDSQEDIVENFDIVHAVVNTDNTPLRSTPVDAGLNRLGHLYKNTELLINGSKGDFYRVFLSDKNTAWIAKKSVNISQNKVFEPAKFLGMHNETYKNATVQTINFSKKLPYTVEDKEKEVVIKFYNPELSGESVYSINIPHSDKYSYSINLDGGQYTIKVKKLPETIKDYTIVVDAGHGGSEKGAVGCLGDLEKDINLKIAYELQKKLSDLGVNVVMTRECDGDLGVYERVAIAQKNDAEIFVSIHLNSIPDICMDIHKNRGTSVYYYNKNSKKLAEYVKNSVVHSAKTRNDGVKTASFAVIRPSDYVGVLVEAAYMTNPLDSVLYSSDDFAKNIAAGIANGICNYIKSK